MGQQLLIRVFLAFTCLTVVNANYKSFENGLILMLKLANSHKTKSFINNRWTKEETFEDSDIGVILTKCFNEDSKCLSSRDYLKKEGLNQADFLSNLIFIAEQIDPYTYFCASTWSGFTLECLQPSLGDCFRDIPQHKIEAIMCTRMPHEGLEIIEDEFKFLTKTAMVNQVSITDLNKSGILSKFTDLHVMFKKPVLDRSDDPEQDLYEYFAEEAKVDLMVRTCAPPGHEKTETLYHPTTGLRIFNVHKTHHSLFSNGYSRSECIDNTKLAYSIPTDKEKDRYLVCFGDLPRDEYGGNLGGGLYCWENKALNRELRCHSAPSPLWHQVSYNSFAHSHAQVVFEEDEYLEWYTDCPEEKRSRVVMTIRNVYNEITRNEHIEL